jgi:hypothetical protein
MEVPTIYKAIFCGDIPVHRPYIGLIYGRYLQFRILKWPLIETFEFLVLIVDRSENLIRGQIPKGLDHILMVTHDPQNIPGCSLQTGEYPIISCKSILMLVLQHPFRVNLVQGGAKRLSWLICSPMQVLTLCFYH